MHRPLRLSRLRLEASEKCLDSCVAELARSAERYHVRERRWPPAGVHCAGAHATDRDASSLDYPSSTCRFAYRLRGPLNVPALERSLAEVVRRHDSLRTGFAWRDELPVALITPAADIKSSLIVEDLTARAPAGNSRAKALLLRKAELEAEQERLKPIDMNHAPLFRASPLSARAPTTTFCF